MTRKNFFIWSLIFLVIFSGGSLMASEAKEKVLSVPSVVVTTRSEFDKPAGVNFNFLWKIWWLVRQMHIDRDTVTDETLVWGAVKGMLEAIDQGRSTLISYDDLALMLDNKKQADIKTEIYRHRKNGQRFNIGYVSIDRFSEDIKDRLADIERKFSNERVGAVILDLRYNLGGHIEGARYLCGAFVGPDVVMAIEDMGGGVRKEILTLGRKIFDIPVVCLVNRYTASASEMVVGALRDVLNAKLVGVKTHGKGSVQGFVRSKEGIIRITVSRWSTPNGHKVDGVGISPDYIISEKSRIYRQDDYTDNVLKKAMEILFND